MRAKARAMARETQHRENLVQEAFDSYLDHTVDRLMALGVDEVDAIEAIFSAVEHLGDEGVLPPFPEGCVSYEMMGRWVVEAASFGFVDFMVEAAQE